MTVVTFKDMVGCRLVWLVSFADPSEESEVEVKPALRSTSGSAMAGTEIVTVSASTVPCTSSASVGSDAHDERISSPAASASVER